MLISCLVFFTRTEKLPHGSQSPHIRSKYLKHLYKCPVNIAEYLFAQIPPNSLFNLSVHVKKHLAHLSITNGNLSATVTDYFQPVYN